MRLQTYVFIISLSLVTLMACGAAKPTTFQTEIWKQEAGNTSPDNPRFTMADDIVRHARLQGLSELEVIKLLGIPLEPPKQKQDQARKELIFSVGELASGEAVVLRLVFRHDRVVQAFKHTI
ncbi:MAG: hypothetical protein JOZ51_23255 [Chloroflexi bacterium]|nr:hypothetical protein [Chloroflexota bacterium]